MKKILIISVAIIVIGGFYLFLLSQISESISIELNQQEYQSNDTITPIIKNSNKKSVWYRPGCANPSWGLEQFIDSEWKSIYLKEQSGNSCVNPLCAPAIFELHPDEIIKESIQINNICVNSKPGGLSLGRYRIRFRYSHEKSFRKENIIYSKPFEIK